MTVRGFCLKDCQYDNSNVTFLSTTSFPQTDSHAGAQLFHSTPEVKSLANRFPCQSASPTTTTTPCLLLLEEICKTDSVYTPDLEKGFGMTVSLNPQVSLILYCSGPIFSMSLPVCTTLFKNPRQKWFVL